MRFEMTLLRKYVTPLLLILFCWYFASTNLREHHVHIVSGKTIAHSHPGASDEHSHSDSQIATIDILTHFQTEQPDVPLCGEGSPMLVSDACSEYEDNSHYGCILNAHKLRGPPQNIPA